MTETPIVPADAVHLAQAAAWLKAGRLVAFPTETVYGLGADAGNAQAVAGIFAAKGRPVDHPLIVHLPDVGALARWSRAVPPVAYRLAEAFWPGPLTLILQRAPSVLDVVTGGQDTIGLRVPDHPVALALLAAFGGREGDGLAAPSANRFGRISPTTAQAVHEELAGRIALILDGGPCRVGIESTILDLSSGRPRLLRPGAITLEALAEVLGEWPEQGGRNVPRASGTLEAHYAPRTPLRLVTRDTLSAVLAEMAGRHHALYAFPPVPETAEGHVELAPPEPAAYAQALYATLRRLDAADFELILVETPPETPVWLAVFDRLRRAAAGAALR